MNVENAKDAQQTISIWMRNRMTLEYLGLWEELYNPDFKPLGFEGFRKEVGMTHQQWQTANPTLKGNQRDDATINQLICISNMENINAVMINENASQKRNAFRREAAQRARRASAAKWPQEAAHSPAAAIEETQRNRHPANAHSF